MEKIVQNTNLPYVWDINGEDYWIMNEIVPDNMGNEPNIKKAVSDN